MDATRLPAEPPVRVVDARRDIDGNYVAENGTFELVRNRDYTLTYKKNTAPGTALQVRAIIPDLRQKRF